MGADSGSRSGAWWRLAALPLMAALVAAVPASLERWLGAATANSLSALWVAWSAHLGATLLLAGAFGVLLPRLPGAAVLLGGGLPVAVLALHELVLESRGIHVVTGIAGPKHWASVSAAALLALGLPCLWGARAIRRVHAGDRRRVVLALSLLALVSGAAGAFRHFRSPEPAPGGRAATSVPNLLLVSIDTLRQDALAAYGGPASALDPWFRSATVLDGWSPSPWTQPALRAMLRGAAPSGAVGGRALRIPTADPWLPAALQVAGYRTAAFVSNPYLRSRFGFARGFQHYDHADEIERLAPVDGSMLARFWGRFLPRRRELGRADRMVQAATKWLTEADDGQPWFVWVHLMDPHLPYTLRGEGGAVRSRTRPDWIDALGSAFDDGRVSSLESLRDDRRPRDEAFVDALRALYASEVDFVAHHAARVLSAAHAASRERALVWVLTSDHGEEFLEHGGFEHGHSLFQELLRVPLVIGGPERGDLPQSMRLQDVGPWFLARHGLPPLSTPEDVLDEALGEELLGRAEPRSGCASALVAGNVLYGPPQARWIAADGTSLLLDGSGGAWRNNVCADRLDRELMPVDDAPLAGPLPDALERWRQAHPGGDAEPIDAELWRELRSLGYLH